MSQVGPRPMDECSSPKVAAQVAESGAGALVHGM